MVNGGAGAGRGDSGIGLGRRVGAVLRIGQPSAGRAILVGRARAGVLFLLCGDVPALVDESRAIRSVANRPAPIVGALAATNLLYHFPLLFTVIGVYATRLPVDAGPLNFRRAMLDPEVLIAICASCVGLIRNRGRGHHGLRLKAGQGRTKR